MTDPHLLKLKALLDLFTVTQISGFRADANALSAGTDFPLARDVQRGKGTGDGALRRWVDPPTCDGHVFNKQRQLDAPKPGILVYFGLRAHMKSVVETVWP